MLKTFLGSSVLACMISILIPTALLAQGQQSEKGEKVNPQVVSQLNLEETQIDQLKKLRKLKKLEIRNYKKELQAARREFQQALQQNADEATLKNKFERLQQARQSLAEAKFEKMLEFRAVLTPEQRKRFQELKSQQN